MAFDEQAFLKQKFVERTSVLNMPILNTWGVEYVTVRGLTAAELAKVETTKLLGDKVSAIAKALSRTKVDTVELKKSIGLSDDVPDDTIKRKELILIGVIEPKLSEAAVVKLSETFPIEFVQISNEVSKLTGMGKAMEKQKPSGK